MKRIYENEDALNKMFEKDFEVSNSSSEISDPGVDQIRHLKCQRCFEPNQKNQNNANKKC